MRLLTLLLASILATQSAVAGDFELKGIALGKPATAATRKALGEATLAGAPCSVTYFQGHGVIEQISAFCKARDFDAVSGALIGKYGKPNDIQNIPMRNGYGAQFTRVIETWVNERGDQLQVINYLNATDSAVLLTTKARLDADAEKQRKAKSDI